MFHAQRQEFGPFAQTTMRDWFTQASFASGSPLALRMFFLFVADSSPTSEISLAGFLPQRRGTDDQAHVLLDSEFAGAMERGDKSLVEVASLGTPCRLEDGVA